jgi:hypothetical protein
MIHLPGTNLCHISAGADAGVGGKGVTWQLQKTWCVCEYVFKYILYIKLELIKVN